MVGTDKPANDMPMIDASKSEVIPTLALPRDKEYAAPGSLSKVDSEDLLLLSVAPWFDVEEIEVQGFFDKLAVEGWLPGGIPLEWTQSWAWCHQYACHDEDLVRQCGESLADISRKFCDKVM